MKMSHPHRWKNCEPTPPTGLKTSRICRWIFASQAKLTILSSDGGESVATGLAATATVCQPQGFQMGMQSILRTGPIPDLTRLPPPPPTDRQGQAQGPKQTRRSLRRSECLKRKPPRLRRRRLLQIPTCLSLWTTSGRTWPLSMSPQMLRVLSYIWIRCWIPRSPILRDLISTGEDATEGQFRKETPGATRRIPTRKSPMETQRQAQIYHLWTSRFNPERIQKSLTVVTGFNLQAGRDEMKWRGVHCVAIYLCICNAYLQTLEMKTYCKCLSHLWCALMPQHARVYASLTNYSEVIPMPMLLLLFTKSRCSHLRQNRNALPFLCTGALCCLQIHLEYLQKNTGSHRNIKKNKKKTKPQSHTTVLWPETVTLHYFQTGSCRFLYLKHVFLHAMLTTVMFAFLMSKCIKPNCTAYV